MDLNETIRKHVLKNAFDYGSAQPSGVIGKIINEIPDSRKDMKATMQLIQEECDKVSKMSKEQIQNKLKNYVFEEKKQREGLPEVDIKGKLTTRFAPNPNAPLHIGHARPAILNCEYAKNSNGEFILRIEDTDAKVKIPMLEAYTWIPEDLEWIGCKPDKTFIQSDRMSIYYYYAQQLVMKGHAYVSLEKSDELKENREKGIESEYRNMKVEEQNLMWVKMVDGFYDEGEAILRLKTEVKHANPSLRDFPIFRIVKAEHPRQETKFKAWPLYNFSCAIDDHELNINLVIRGKDHEVNALKQEYIYKYFGWNQPKVLEHGMLNVEGMAHKSEIVEEMKKGKLEGWDDIRLSTLRALRKRGIRAEAIRKYIIGSGLNPTDSNLDWSLLYKFNKDILNEECERYFFVKNPVKIKVNYDKTISVKLRKHPVKEMGFREITFTPEEIYVAKEDFEKYEGKNVRLKGCMTIKLGLESEFVSLDKSGDEQVIQWIGKNNNKAEIKKNDGSTITGITEPECKLKEGTQIQFERMDYVRFIKQKDEVQEYYWTH